MRAADEVEVANSVFVAGDWYQALTLGERRNGQGRPAPVGDPQRAAWRYRLWQRAAARSDGAMQAYLAGQGLDRDLFLRYLGESGEDLAQRYRQRPPWLEDLETAFAPALQESPRSRAPSSRFWSAIPFANIAGPVARRALKRLETVVEQLTASTPLALPHARIEQLFLQDLLIQIHAIAYRTVTLELNVARELGQLTGESPQERFAGFTQRLREPEAAIEILRAYPVLARQILVRCEQWFEHCSQFLRRLAEDWNLLADSFSSGRDLGALCRIKMGAGDRHRGGKSVILAAFENGLRVVYKPRSLAVDVHFSDLLECVNDQLRRPIFRPHRSLDRGGHGWQEFVAARTCSTSEELRNFYFRQGCNLALLYLLDGTDIHLENVIASGEYPILIDLETLFAPVLSAAPQSAELDLGDSVLRTRLLPNRFVKAFGDIGSDTSGLGAIPGELSDGPVTVFENANTDEMRLVKRHAPIETRRHRPTDNHEPGELIAHAGDVAEGFSTLYRFFMAEREMLTAASGPIAALAQDPVRIVFRATREYSNLINDSFHPDLAQHALHREGYFEKLWAAVPHLPWLKEITGAERDDLLRGDVPYFTARPGSRDLWTSDGRRIENFIPYVPLDRVMKRVARLSESGLARQVSYIRGSIACSGRSAVVSQPPGAPAVHGASGPVSRSDLLSPALAIGNRIIELADCTDDHASWIGVTLIAPDQYGLQQVDGDLYSGLSGIALFLGFLGLIGEQEDHTRFARRTLNSARGAVSRMLKGRGSIGAFSGIGGYLYAVAELSCIWELPEYLDELPAMLDTLRERIARDQRFDIISGGAGLIAVLLRLFELTGERTFLDSAEECGNALASQAEPQETGVAWKTMPEVPALGGFSHGAAGISWALQRLAHATGSERLEHAANESLAFDRSLFVAEEHNWKDLRLSTVVGRKCSCFWCHGAPGIGLARLSLLKIRSDARMRSEIDVAIGATLRSGLDGNHSLCHGSLGNLEFLSLAARTLGNRSIEDEANKKLRGVLDAAARSGWQCGTPECVETPGLMTGLAGIGYGLLRFADPLRVPGVLTLSGPQ